MVRGLLNLKLLSLFGDVSKFREVLRECTIQKGCKIIRQKNEKPSVTYHCATEGCEWRIHASPLEMALHIKLGLTKGNKLVIPRTHLFSLFM